MKKNCPPARVALRSLFYITETLPQLSASAHRGCPSGRSGAAAPEPGRLPSSPGEPGGAPAARPPRPRRLPGMPSSATAAAGAQVSVPRRGERGRSCPLQRALHRGVPSVPRTGSDTAPRLCCPRESAATQRGSSPGGYSRSRAATVSLCTLLMPTMAGSACAARLPGCRCCRADPAVRTHRPSRPWHWGDAQAGGLQTSGQEPL